MSKTTVWIRSFDPPAVVRISATSFFRVVSSPGESDAEFMTALDSATTVTLTRRHQLLASNPEFRNPNTAG